MATFPAIPHLYNSTETVVQDMATVKLGDGYKQRLVFGLPVNKRLLQLTLKFDISQTQADTINTFLDARFDDQESFDFTPAGHSASKKFICTRRRSTKYYLNRVKMDLSFEECAEP